MVDVNFAFLCMNCEVREDGSLDAVGVGFNMFAPPELPSQIFFRAVIDLSFGPGELGTHELGIKIVDLDGNIVFGPFNQIRTFEPPSAMEFYRNHSTIMDMDLTFAKAGDYVAVWLLDGHDVNRFNFTVSLPTTAP